MNDFRNEYQSAVQDMDMLGMKEIHIDAVSVMDERRHRRCMMKRLQRVTATTFSAVCVIFLCGFGTVKAAEYIGNVIKVNEWGFESGDAATMAKSGAGGSQIHIVQDEVSLVSGENSENGEGVLEEGLPAECNFPAAQQEKEMLKEEGSETALADEGAGSYADAQKSRSLDSGGMAGVEPMSGGPGEAGDMADAGDTGAIEEIPVKNYDSWEEFEKNEDIIFAQPSISIGSQITSTNVTVCGDWVMVRYDVDGKVLWMERTDYADTQGHASTKVFPGGVCNKRSYTTPQGYTYMLIDSVKAADNNILQIHAAVTVGSYEAFIDFMGYTEAEAKRIMDSIDLSVYE